LPVEPEWSTDGIDMRTINTKDLCLNLAGNWIIEIGEITHRRATIERDKAFMSRQVEHYRRSYERVRCDWPRMWGFAGTSNDLQRQSPDIVSVAYRQGQYR
jgi:predicted P-loop ATPase